MSTAQSTPASSARRFSREGDLDQDEPRGTGWVLFAGVMLALLAIAQVFFIPAYPILSVMLFSLDILVINGLVAHGARTSEV